MSIRAQQPRPIEYWVKTLARPRVRLQTRLLERLVQTGALRADDSRLGIVNRRRYRVADLSAVLAGTVAVRSALFTDDYLEPRAASLAGLAAACGMLDDLLPPSDHPQASARIAELAAADPVARAVRRAVREARWSAGGAEAGVIAALVASTASS